jgi:hypothetical protein
MMYTSVRLIEEHGSSEDIENANYKNVARFADARSLLLQFEDAILTMSGGYTGLMTLGKWYSFWRTDLWLTPSDLRLIDLLLANCVDDIPSTKSCWMLSSNMPVQDTGIISFQGSMADDIASKTLDAFRHFAYDSFSGTVLLDHFQCESDLYLLKRQTESPNRLDIRGNKSVDIIYFLTHT